MSTIKAENIAKGANSTDMDNAIFGSARVLVSFNGEGTIAIDTSYNVSSLQDDGTGVYVINFTNAFADTNFKAFFNANDDISLAGVTYESGDRTSQRTTGKVRMQCVTNGGVATDPSRVMAAIFA